MRANLLSDQAVPTVLQDLVDRLRWPALPDPCARSGPLDNPIFLGLIPTRGCNLDCRYCDFVAPKKSSPVMDLDIARSAVDAYLRMLQVANRDRADIHFFGGEPFYAETVVHFVVEYATCRAAELGLTVHFEAITNGLFNSARCHWIAERFDTVVLSLDGPSDIQECHRPAFNGHPTFPVIERNARIFSDSTVELILRACVTRNTVARLAEIARWFGQTFRPSLVCFESLTSSPLSMANGLRPPDPWEFARNFEAAAQVLDEYGIETVLSTADISARRATFCPVGQDALIVSPDGAVNACYLLPEEWRQHGLDLQLGIISDDRFELDPIAVLRARRLTVQTKTLCADCLCRYHCAGGCHVNHCTSVPAGQYDDLCIQTRLVTITRLLKQLSQDALAQEWLANRPALEAAAWQRNDRLISQELTP